MTEKLSLTELQLIIRDSLYLALPDLYWVVAEISEIKENSSGHCYLELIEKHPDEKNVKARIKAIVWNNRFRLLNPLFENITGEPLRAGMKILVRVKIEYHELYGLSLIVSDIDPSFTIGEMALKRQLIIKRLEEEGVFTMNKEISLPVVPQKIAVISSVNAAGYTDFIIHLTQNTYGYVFYTALFETVLQGTETEESVISSLDRIADYRDLFDTVVIIRGGGSQTDLSWFDNYNIAFHITQFPLPVITGIGHEKDLSVTDMVAYNSLKTPTAVADYLIDTVARAELLLNEISTDISEYSMDVINENLSLMESYRIKLLPVSKLAISRYKESLSDKIIEMIDLGKGYILKAGIIPLNQKSRLITSTGSFSSDIKSRINRHRLDLMNLAINHTEKYKSKTESLNSSLKILDPVNVLKRGYTITTLRGKIIKSAKNAALNDIIDTRFSDGKITSKVIKKDKSN